MKLSFNPVLHIKSLYVKIDFKEAIYEESNNDRTVIPIISDCRKFLQEFKRYKFRHIFREANKTTNKLAKKFVVMEEKFEQFKTVPNNLKQFLLYDFLGILGLYCSKNLVVVICIS